VQTILRLDRHGTLRFAALDSEVSRGVIARHPFLAHHAAEEDLGSRKDVYAFDTFAWGTYQYWKNIPASVTGEGDALLDEAEAAMEKALSTGIKDAKVLFHAGMIYWKRDRTRAAGYLREALAINPHFHALQAKEAQALLALR